MGIENPAIGDEVNIEESPLSGIRVSRSIDCFLNSIPELRFKSLQKKLNKDIWNSPIVVDHWSFIHGQIMLGIRSEFSGRFVRFSAGHPSELGTHKSRLGGEGRLDR
jgi:hypothetical protein